MRHDRDPAKSYPLFEVSCKILIFNPARTHVLLAAYDDGLYGLPGGHLEPDETPTLAAARELREELDLSLTSLAPLTFGFHPEKQKVILLFQATLPDDTPLPPAPPNDEHLLTSRWIAISAIRADNQQLYLDDRYRALVLPLLSR